MAEYLASGIDVSEFNGDVDIAALRDRVDFVIIRCGYGSDLASQDDTRFEENVRKCVEADIPYGVYLYSYAVTPAQARSEAAHTLRLLTGKRPLYGVWYDVEDGSLPWDQGGVVTNCVEYCTAIRQAGYYCGIYSPLYRMVNFLDSPRLAEFDRWVAQWNETLDYPGAGIWQYTNDGTINGQRFDLDRAFRDYPAITGDETDLTEAEVIALARREAQRVYSENERRYATPADVPEWARAAVEEVYDRLSLLGTGDAGDETQINASATYIRALYVISKVLELIESESAARE